MTNLFRILTVVLVFITFYLFLNAKTNPDLFLATTSVFMTIVSMCFVIMGEQKQEIERLRKGINSYTRSMEHTGHKRLDDNTSMDTYKDRKGRRWFKVNGPQAF